jgi:multicomponent Na+:H+ antiporter subunit F
MILLAETLTSAALNIALVMIGLGMFLALGRLVYGPSLPDRVVALDFIATSCVGVIAVFSMMSEQTVLMDAAMVVALIGFLGTIVFARYVEWRGHRG